MACATSHLHRSLLRSAGVAAALAVLGWTVPVSTQAQTQAAKPNPRLSVALSVIGNIRQGGTVQVRGDVTAHFASPSVEVKFVTPAGLTPLGSSSWNGSLAPGQSMSLTFQVRLDKADITSLAVVASDTTALPGERAVAMEAMASSYLAIGKQKGFADQNYSERMVPAGRRALRELVGAKAIPMPTPEQQALQPGEMLLTPAGGAPVTTELGAALAQIDAQGVEALFEDSSAQVSKVKSAIAKDKAAGKHRRTAAAATPGPAMAMEQAAMACPVNYVVRTGVADFLNTNSGARERMPNLLVVAIGAPPGSPGDATTFRIRADGTYSACLPYDPNGRTYMTVYQDIGPVFMFRDGASPPSTFPTWWYKAWDLVNSGTVPIDTKHSEVSFALLTFYKAVTASYSVFTARRGQINAWYYGNTDLDYYCDNGGIGQCSRTGENIYVHRWAPTPDGPYDNIYTPYGRFARAHEYGHGYDDAILGDIGTGCSGDHSYSAPNTVGCAVNEGWADFFAFAANHKGDFNPELSVGNTTRGPEIEGAVAGYLFDLIDDGSFPYFHTEDDAVKVTGDYVVSVLKNGRTNLGGLVKRVSEIIALVDDVTPVPAKSEFSAFTQPASLTARVARPSNLTVAQNRVLWRRSVFNLVDAPPPPPPTFIVSAGAPEYITVKTTYALTGSANAPANSWRWDRGDDGAAYTLWANAQNSQFVAYAGRYTIGWRLTARRITNPVNGTGFATTTVCIQSTSCSGGPIPIVRPQGEILLAAQLNPMSGSSSGAELVVLDQNSKTEAEHFGAGPWISEDGESDSAIVQLYSLSGSHHNWAPQQPRPNSFAKRLGTVSKWKADVGVSRAALSEIRTALSPTSTAIYFVGQELRRESSYRVSFALDPDLGAGPEDDRLIWMDSIGVAVVVDADASALAYGYAGNMPGATTTAREYTGAGELAEPETSVEAYRDQRSPSRIVGKPNDVRLTLTAGPFRPNADRGLEVALLAARGKTVAEAVATLVSDRERLSLAAQNVASAAGSSQPSAFALRQSLAGGSASFSATGASGASTATTRAQLRESGITALEYAVPAGQQTEVRILIYGNRGQLVRTLVRESRSAGQYQVQWDKLNERGERVAPGVYTAVMEAADFRAMRKLVVTR